MLKKSQFVGLAAGSGVKEVADELSLIHSNLWSFLTQTTWEDGTPRATGSLLIFEDGGTLKCMAKDKGNALCLWTSAPSLGELLGVVDAALVDPTADWRKDRFVGQGKTKGK